MFAKSLIPKGFQCNLCLHETFLSLQEDVGYLCYPIKIKKNIGVGFRRGRFLLQLVLLQTFLGAKKSFSFLIFYLCLGSMEVKDIYHQLVLTMSYYYVLAIVIYSYRQFIYSAKPLQGLYVYLKLNQICLSFISKNLQFCRAY